MHSWFLILLLTACAPTVRADVIYRTYLPLAIRDLDTAKGIALSADWACNDMQTVNAGWYHAWMEGPPFCAGQTDAEFVPMLRDGNSTICYPIVMLFNEPDLWPHYTAEQIAQAALDYQAQCPDAEIVLGNFSHLGLQHARDTLALLPDFDGVLGVHWYLSSPQTLEEFLDEAQAIHPRLWLTEFSVFGYANAGQVANHVATARQYTERWAWYTNRCTTGDTWCEGGLEFTLFDNQGQLTPLGIAYRDSQ